jgi:hypothetical protein
VVFVIQSILSDLDTIDGNIIDYSMLRAAEAEKQHQKKLEGVVDRTVRKTGCHAFEDLTDLENDEFIVSDSHRPPVGYLLNVVHSMFISLQFSLCSVSMNETHFTNIGAELECHELHLEIRFPF